MAIDISDLSGFEDNFEISNYIKQYTLDKTRIESELAHLNQKLLAINSSILSIKKYNSSEKATFEKLFNNYDNIESQIQELSQPQYFEIQLEQQEQEIVLILKSLELMMQKAATENICLPSLPDSVLYTIDKYNLYQLSQRT